jgi:hypothetical protein
MAAKVEISNAAREKRASKTWLRFVVAPLREGGRGPKILNMPANIPTTSGPVSGVPPAPLKK